MVKERNNCIDVMKGITIIWMAWYHTTHPEFVNYHFFVPAFFIMSGFFASKLDWKTFWSKKWNQLIIPFVFFYIIYWCFLVIINSISTKSLSTEYLYHISDVFKWYTGNDAYVVNYPLWFVTALIVIQATHQITIRIIGNRNRIIILLLALVISVADLYWFQYIPTPFMLGKALKFYLYYEIGFTIGNPIISRIKNTNKTQDFLYAIICVSIVVACIIIEAILLGGYKESEFNYLEICAVSFLGIVLSKYISRVLIHKPLAFFGRYSLIVLGFHELYLSILRIITTSIIGGVNILWGVINLVITILLLIPTIITLSKNTPKLVGIKNKI